MSHRVLVADGGMGTMLHTFDPTEADYDGYEGCSDMLCLTRPDIVTSVHDAFLEAGSDAIETNSFNANFGGLVEYDIVERAEELAYSAARLARDSCDAFSTEEKPRYVLGSMGPGTKLPSLGHAPFARLRDSYADCARGLLRGGSDALLVETSQDLLQTKAAVIGAHRAIASTDIHVPIIAHVTVETTGTMLVGSEIGAALTSLTALGVDMVGLNCATGPAEMTEHLRYLSRHSRLPLSVMPNAGLPQLSSDGAYFPLQPDELAEALDEFTADYGFTLVGGCCGTTPEHIKAVTERLNGRTPVSRSPQPEPGVSSSYHHVPFRQDATILNVGERTNANGSKAFREAMLDADWDACVDIAREQNQGGSHLLDLCVDYVGRDGTVDMAELAGRFSTASTLPIMLDSTEPAVIEAGLEQLGGRCVINSVNFEDGDGPESRFQRIMPIVAEHGAAVVALCIDEDGQARDRDWKVRVAERLISELTGTWGMNVEDIFIDALTFPVTTGQEETRRDGLETIAAITEIARRYPGINFTLGISNISFGVNPAARQVLNSVFLHECVSAGLNSAIVHSTKILPMGQIPDEQKEVALDLVYDRRGEDYDPLQQLIELFDGVTTKGSKAARAEALNALPLEERLAQRIIDGNKDGLEQDLDAALSRHSALDIINRHLLEGMKIVGDRFGSGQMQLPFVLQSAETMKTAVAQLEPHMEQDDADGKGTIVLATVRGDVHDIGKNLVDIILSNNGYSVVNLGIKQPIGDIIDAAEQHGADAIGMSGLLVKSTVIMRDNLAELTARGLAGRWPVLLGGAALTRSYVEDDLRENFDDGEVHYARDAFEGLELMDRLMAHQRGDIGEILTEEQKAKIAARRRRRERTKNLKREQLPSLDDTTVRSDTSLDNPVPRPPFWGNRIVKGLPQADYAAFLDERATFLGQWGLKGTRGTEGPGYEELVETEGRPRLRYWLERLAADNVLDPQIVYGYYPAYAEGNSVVVLDEDRDKQIARFDFPRQRHDKRLCLSDFFHPKDGDDLDVIAMQLVTLGSQVSDYTNKLFENDEYRDYLEVHGLTVQLTEALAEYWHARVRGEWQYPQGGAVADSDPESIGGMFRTEYAGCRYSFGYPACPNLADRAVLVDILGADRIGVQLSEGDQLHPEQSTDAVILHHPEASYFNAK
ncbi:methionine synthase [Haloglycomyces albus]|uniref:methionine synthase n=1 Tax=Haloglycomyces albus TaxID=526067 RepID=UPI0004A3772C